MVIKKRPEVIPLPPSAIAQAFPQGGPRTGRPLRKAATRAHSTPVHLPIERDLPLLGHRPVRSPPCGKVCAIAEGGRGLTCPNRCHSYLTSNTDHPTKTTQHKNNSTIPLVVTRRTIQDAAQVIDLTQVVGEVGQQMQQEVARRHRVAQHLLGVGLG